MRTIRFAIVGAFAACASLGLQTLRAADDPVAFLHALQRSGYPDIAVDYLKMLKDQPDAPKEVIELWDFEMSRSLRAASKGAYNEAEAKRLLEEAEKFLDTFIKQRPDHPKAIEAAAWWAEVSLIEALKELRRAKDLTDKAQQAEVREKARETLKEVSRRYARGEESTLKQFRNAPAPAGKDKRAVERAAEKRLELEEQWTEARLRTAVAAFYLAETYDEQAPERKTILETVAKRFDAIYQPNRGSVLGLNAHFWQGRALHALGKLVEAMDIYDEVDASGGSTDEADSDQPRRTRRDKGDGGLGGLEELFAATQQFRLEIIAKRSKKEYLGEAIKWREEKKSWERTDGYQGISLGLAKTLIQMGQQLTGNDQQRLYTQASKIVRGMLKVPSQYQREAYELLKTIKGADAEGGFEQLIIEGDEAAAAKKWMEAAKLYKEALEEAAKLKSKVDPKRIAQVRDAISKCYYQVAHEAFAKGDLKNCREAARTIITEYRETDMAPKAAALAVTVALNEYATLPEDTEKEEKDVARGKVVKMCEFVLANWPGKPEADFIRLNLGKIELFDKKVEEAIKVFSNINPKSEYYATALYLIGYTRWRSYDEEKKKVEKDQQQDKKKQYRDEAVKAIAGCVATHRGAMQPGARIPRPMFEAALLLADMKMEGDEAREAAALFQELADDVVKEKPEKLDPTMLKAFNGAVRAYLQLEEVEKAGNVAKLLIDLGPDDPQTNASLLSFAGRLEKERKKVEDAVNAAPTPTEAKEAKAKLKSFEDLLASVLKNLSVREKVSPTGMIWIAQMCANVGLADETKAQCEKVLRKIDEDEGFAEAVKRGIPRIRVIMINMMRKEGKYDDAFKQASSLAEENPKALEPRLEKCQILQAWSEKDPAQYPKAIMEWDRLRNIMERMKKRPAEFYDVVYNEALCFHNMAQSGMAQSGKGNKESLDSAKKGEQLLKQLLLLDKNVSAENVKRYRALIKKLEILQLKEPSSTKADPAKDPAS